MPTEYGSYGDYGAYKRDAKPEAAPIAEPEANAEPEAEPEAKPQYGEYGEHQHRRGVRPLQERTLIVIQGDYGSYDVASYGNYPAEEVGQPTEYGSYGDYG